MILRLVRGIPGSGKSTWAKKMFSSIILENDMWCMQDDKYNFDAELHGERIKACYGTVELCLDDGMDVVVCNTFVKLEYMEDYIDLAEQFDAELKVYKVIGDFGSVHDVPDEIIQKMKDEWEDFVGEKVIDLTGR